METDTPTAHLLCALLHCYLLLHVSDLLLPALHLLPHLVDVCLQFVLLVLHLVEFQLGVAYPSSQSLSRTERWQQQQFDDQDYSLTFLLLQLQHCAVDRLIFLLQRLNFTRLNFHIGTFLLLFSFQL